MDINDLSFNGARIPYTHEYGWIENVLAEKALPKKVDHDKEHEDMLILWGCKPEHTSKLTFRKNKEGEMIQDRLYHALLHLKYWKQTNLEKCLEFVKKFEEQSGLDLDKLKTPDPNSFGDTMQY